MEIDARLCDLLNFIVNHSWCFAKGLLIASMNFLKDCFEGENAVQIENSDECFSRELKLLFKVFRIF